MSAMTDILYGTLAALPAVFMPENLLYCLFGLVFGILWGALFLGEALPAAALAGGVLILAGTVLVTRG